jgi:hypothetical protein
MNETITAAQAYVGMLLILVAFVLETRGSLSSRGNTYLGLMAVGSAMLAVRAAHSREWAFLILEAVWCVAAIIALLRPRKA